MAAGTSKEQPAYRWQAFTHWANLSLLAATGVAGAFVDPMIWLAAAPLELATLWIIADLPTFRTRVDATQSARDLLRERGYYLAELWGLAPMKKSLGRRILESFAEVEDGDLDLRVIHRDQTFGNYAGMRKLVAKLSELEKLRGASPVSNEIERLEQAINGYLRYLLACRSLYYALEGMDGPKLLREVEMIDAQLEGADASLRAVLLERRRLRKSQLDRLPKLRATLELLRTRADAIVYQMQNLHAQLLADPGVNVNTFLDEMVEKHELLSDPLGDLEADQEIREFLQADRPTDARAARAGAKSGLRSVG